MGKSYPFWLDVAPLAITAVILGIQFFVFKDFTPHIPLVIGICITGLFMFIKGQKWADMEEHLLKVMKIGLPAILILMCVGMLIGTWIVAGTVPTIVYYGLKALTPSTFLATACVLCSLVSLATGTSWGTLGTVGLAVMGIGEALGIPIYWTAGVVVSGSFFGDKMSPLSETTQLTAAVTGINPWAHIKGMLPTTVPAIIITLIIYALIGMQYADSASQTETSLLIQTTMESHFQLGWLTLLPAISVIYMGYKKYSAMGTICVGVLLGALVAVFIQGAAVKDIFNILQNGYSSQTGVPYVDTLLSKGGVMSMTWVITLTLFSLGFVGALEIYGTFTAILKKINSLIKGRLSLVLVSYTSVLGVGTGLGDVYTSIVLPGRLMKDKYTQMGYKRTTLARSIEDCGTLMSPLIPWNMGGGFVTATLGIPTIVYAPFAIFCWLSPLIGILWAFTGWFIPREENVPELMTAQEDDAPIDLT
ncbi:MAG: Na+/H+ antiporter NhaC, partial [Neisseriaceae bacterium]|nr:Na+/H+ antiporter NhaC [Neisseriaceae bacterium]